MKRTILLLFLYCCAAATIFGQQRFSLPEADAIGYSKGGYYLSIYTKLNDGRYILKRLTTSRNNDRLYGASDMDLIDWKMRSEVDTVSRSEMEKNDDYIFDVENLRSLSLKDYIGKTFDIEEGGEWKRDKTSSQYVLKILRSDLAVVQELYYEKVEGIYLRCVKSFVVPDSVKTWHAYRSNHLLPLVLELKGGKNVLLFHARGFEYTLLSTTKGDLLINLKYAYQPVSLADAGGKYADAEAYDFQDFYSKRYFGLRKTEEGKLQLLNGFGEKVLKLDYDSINYDGRFIIAKNGNSIDLYNLYLEKLNVGALKAAREVVACNVGTIEVLTENGPFYYDEKGNKIKKPTKLGWALCGTVPIWTYSLRKKNGSYQFKKYTGGPGVRDEVGERYILSDCQPTDSVSFLSGDKEFERDGNSDIVGEIEMYPEWIRVGRKGKYGIISYNYKQPEGVNPKKTIKRLYDWVRAVLTYPVLKLKGKTLLPIVYDSIIMRRDGLIYFYKDGKVGLFPRDKEPLYDELEQRTKSFYYIKKNGIEGWLDIKTNKEYFFPKSDQ